MSKIKLSILSLAALLVSATFFIACSNNEDHKTNSIVTEGIVAFNAKTKKVYVKELSQGIDDNQARLLGDNEYLIKFSFTPNEKMPSFVSEELLKEYMLKYPMKANGLIELVIDNELVYSVQIINGAKFNEIIKEASFNKAYPCTLTGIRTCAVDGIRNQNWFDMTNCVLEGIGCVANWYGSCIADNC